MNDEKRSGDIVLIMKDSIITNDTDRYTTGVACKSWHGSLNPSDSYVPFMLSYPGGNIGVLESLFKKTVDGLETYQAISGCDKVNDVFTCDYNYRMKDVIKKIIEKQY